MNDILPLAPQSGLSTPLYLFLLLMVGILFGFALERAGFGSARNLTAIFILRDFRVFRVMFTAVLTTMLGAHLLHFTGIMNISLIPVEANYGWVIVAGGLIFGAGFYIGGFCPGTAVVAMARGRWDGAAFLLGIILGIFVFAELFDLLHSYKWFISFFAPPDSAPSTLPGEGPVWPWIAGISAAAFLGFLFTPLIEKHFGLSTVGQLKGKKTTEASQSERDIAVQNDQEDMKQKTEKNPDRVSIYHRTAAAIAGIALTGIIITELILPYPELLNERPRPAAIIPTEDKELIITAKSLAGWLIEDAHRNAEGEKELVFVFDKREQKEVSEDIGFRVADIKGSVNARKNGILGTLRMKDISGNATIVILGDNNETNRDIVSGLRRFHFNTHLLDSSDWNGLISADPVQTGLSEPLLSAWTEARDWFTGEREKLPPRFVFPGAIPPITDVKTVIATGTGAGGGCN